jgi:WD40 repeat protein
MIHPTRGLHARLSVDGDRVLTIDGDGVARLWHQLATAPVAEKLDAPGRFTFADFSPNGRQFITVMEGREALVWETSGRRARFGLKHAERILCAAFGANGRLAATGSADMTARVWDTETGQPITAELAHEGPVTHLAFSPDGRRLATSDGTRARLWSTRSGESSTFLLRHDAAITSLSFSPDGKRLVTAAEDGAVRLWDAVSGQSLAPALRHPAAVREAALSPDGRYIAGACGERVWLWNARTFEVVPPVFAHNATVQGVQFSPSGQHLLTASIDGTARLFALDSSPGTPPTGRTPGEWMLWAQLMSGRQVSSNEQVMPIPASSLRKLWTELKGKSPSDFRAGELPAWHQRLAEAAEHSRDWFAAGFHWERALGSQPGDERFRAGLEKARSEQARLETVTAPGVEPPLRIPPRAKNVGADLLDLSAHYNAALTETWLPVGEATSGNDLSSLPRGVQRFGGVEFDVRGIIQLSGGALENLGGRFPTEVDAIPVGRPCRKIHFLHGAGWSARAGTHIGSYTVHYADGESRDIKIVFGQNVREWLASPAAPMMTGGAVAWEGSNQAGRTLGLTVRVYQMTWLNPRPAVEVRQIRFKSTMENPAPFLIAITTESPKE